MVDEETEEGSVAANNGEARGRADSDLTAWKRYFGGFEGTFKEESEENEAKRGRVTVKVVVVVGRNKAGEAAMRCVDWL